MIAEGWPRTVINGNQRDIYYRFGHEMEIPFEIKDIDCSHAVEVQYFSGSTIITCSEPDCLCKVTV